MALSDELKTMHQLAKLLEGLRERDAAAAQRVEDWLKAKLSETQPPLPGLKV